MPEVIFKENNLDHPHQPRTIIHCAHVQRGNKNKNFTPHMFFTIKVHRHLIDIYINSLYAKKNWDFFLIIVTSVSSFRNQLFFCFVYIIEWFIVWHLVWCNYVCIDTINSNESWIMFINITSQESLTKDKLQNYVF